MPATQGPNAGLSLGWSPGEDFWGGPMNDNLLFLDSFMFPYIRTASRASPPADAKNGDMYIVATGGSGAWANADGLLALLVDDKWTFYQPKKGLRTYLQSTKRFVWFDGSNWVNEADGSDATNPTPENNPKQYHVAVTIPYQPSNSELLLFMPTPIVIQIKKGGGSSIATLKNPSPGYVQLVLNRNGKQFGTIDFENGNSDGTFNIPETTTFTRGDHLEMVAPADVLTDFKNIGITMVFDTING